MKIVLYILLLFNANLFAQTNQYAVYLGCYTDKDTIPDGVNFYRYDLNAKDSIPTIPSPSLLKKDGTGQSNAWITSYEIAVYDSNGKITIIEMKYNSTSIPDMSILTSKDNRPKKIIIQGIKILEKTTNANIERKLPPHTFYRAQNSQKKCNSK